MQKNKDGMRYPSIDKLLSKIDSKYKLVYAASKVAQILETEKLQVEDAQCVKINWYCIRRNFRWKS
jgi:DNA-directed RNA polymerase subunit omega